MLTGIELLHRGVMGKTKINLAETLPSKSLQSRVKPILMSPLWIPESTNLPRKTG